MPLTYDAWNRLVKVVDGPTLAEFRYDGLNRRVVKYDGSSTSPNATYDFYYNVSWQVVEVREDADVDPLEEFVWHPYYVDAVAVRFYDSNLNGSQLDYYYVQDTNHNVVAIGSSSGAVQERYRYAVYGELTVLDSDFTTDADGLSDLDNRITYTGRRFDGETGLLFCRNRYYDSPMGRFISRDAITYSGSEYNLYEYVKSSVFRFLDPFGLCPGGFQTVTPAVANDFTKRVKKDSYFSDPDLGRRYPGPPSDGTVSDVKDGCYTVTRSCKMVGTCIKYTGRIIQSELISSNATPWKFVKPFGASDRISGMFAAQFTRDHVEIYQDYEEFIVLLKYSCVQNRICFDCGIRTVHTNNVPYYKYHTSGAAKSGPTRVNLRTQFGKGRCWSDGMKIIGCNDPDGKRHDVDRPVFPYFGGGQK